MPSAKAHFLPEEFLQRLRDLSLLENYESLTFQPDFHAERIKFLDVADPFDPDSFVVGPTGQHPDADIPRTYLHLASLIGDILLLCEMIRMGATIDILDAKGNTALFLALESIISCQMSLQADIPVPKELRTKGVRKQPVSELRLSAMSRLAYMARVLIEQHADVNRTINGITPLHVACKLRDWDLIALLLEHGANPSPVSAAQYPPPINWLSSSSDKSRFSALVKEFPSGYPRPGRTCPCWSGKPLAVCHATNTVPYPPSLLCVCASGKSYEKCCARRKMTVSEKWDEVRKRIAATSMTSVPLPNISKHQEDRLNTNIGRMMDAEELRKSLGMESPSPMQSAIQHQKEMADEMLAKGLMDPAYAYALKLLEFSPRPQGLRLSKRDCREYQEQWNAVIDMYISLGRDKRPRGDIERAAKIGLSNGALYRRCEGTNCDKVEGKNMVKPLFCSRCKMSVYCSVPCQKSAWKSHKTVCGSDKQHEQALPSQEAIDAYALPKLFEQIAEMDLTPPPEIQAFLDAQRKQRK